MHHFQQHARLDNLLHIHEYNEFIFQDQRNVNNSMQVKLRDDRGETMRLMSGKGKSRERESPSTFVRNRPNPGERPSPVIRTPPEPTYDGFTQRDLPSRSSISSSQSRFRSSGPVLAVKHFRSTTTAATTTSTSPRPTVKLIPKFTPKRVVVGKKTVNLKTQFSLGTACSFEELSS